MFEETKKSKNIIERIRTMLLNYELSIAWARGEIRLKDANIKVNSQLPNPKKYNIRRQKEAKVEKLKAEIYLQEIENAKRELVSDLNLILDQYEPRYKKVFIMYYFNKSTYQEIADATNYGVDNVKRIINLLKNEIMNFFES